MPLLAIGGGYKMGMGVYEREREGCEWMVSL